MVKVLGCEDFFDAAIIKHGFADYMRDYEIIVLGMYGPPWDDLHRYQFVGCVEANVRTKVAPDAFRKSIGDDFVYSGPEFPDKPDPDGFIWGVRASSSLGMVVVDDSALAATWSEKLNMKMTEVTIDTEAFHIQLVFSELRSEFLGRDPSPLTFTRSNPIKIS